MASSNIDVITAIAMTEPGAGSDLANIKTTARCEGGHYIVNGEKTFITNGIYADLVVVVCKTDPKASPVHRGISLLLVENGTEGFKRGKKLDKVGQHCSDTGELRCSQAAIFVFAPRSPASKCKGLQYRCEESYLRPTPLQPFVILQLKSSNT